MENNLTALLASGMDGGGIPLTIKMVSETQPYQFYISIALTIMGSFFIFLILWNSLIKPIVGEMLISIKLSYAIKKTGRNIMVIKHTERGLFNMSMIDQSTIRKVIKGMQKFKGEAFDLILYTPGGDIFSATYISRLLKEYPAKIRAIIPIYAMSGGTLLALSCDEVHMAETACLGCVDPQLGNLFKFGSAKSWEHIVKYKGKKADDSTISFALMGKQYTKSIAAVITELLQGKKMSNSQKRNFVKTLTSGELEHAHPFTITKLKEYGFPVTPLDQNMAQVFTKLLASDMFEGVYAFRRGGKK